jgi:hypothetical protein
MHAFQIHVGHIGPAAVGPAGDATSDPGVR